jgi:hypothetical protein
MNRAALLLALLLFVFALDAPAQSDASKFRYQPNKISVGAVYHYVKTNIDGTPPAENITIYVASKDRIEVFKSRTKGERAAFVIADMDWTTFSARRLESWQAFPGGEKKLAATLDYDAKEKVANVLLAGADNQIEKTAIKHLPFHVYNFDLSSLNFAFRHLAKPKENFTIGIADPTFKASGPLFEYRGEATVSYIGEETRDGVPCLKYKIDGAGLLNRGGFIWVDKKGEFFRDIEIQLPDNPEWKTFKFKLIRVEQMTRDQWEAFMKEQL